MKAYDVPAVHQKSSFAVFLGSKIGQFVDGEVENMFVADKCPCFGVDVNVSKPLNERSYDEGGCEANMGQI